MTSVRRVSPSEPADMNARYTLDGDPVDLDEFLADNAETFTGDEVAAARALRAGEQIVYGGGAWATFVLRRVEQG